MESRILDDFHGILGLESIYTLLYSVQIHFDLIECVQLPIYKGGLLIPYSKLAKYVPLHKKSIERAWKAWDWWAALFKCGRCSYDSRSYNVLWWLSCFSKDTHECVLECLVSLSYSQHTAETYSTRLSDLLNSTETILERNLIFRCGFSVCRRLRHLIFNFSQ